MFSGGNKCEEGISSTSGTCEKEGDWVFILRAASQSLERVQPQWGAMQRSRS
jgi:hypothetical protein